MDYVNDNASSLHQNYYSIFNIVEESSMQDIIQPFDLSFSNSIYMKFILVEAGSFLMGCPYSDEKPQHKVNISRPYYRGKYPVTQMQWKEIMGYNHSNFKGDNRPVENVSWEDAQKFIEKLNKLEGHDRYRLPTEAEWEFAARGGNISKYYKYCGSNIIDEVAQYD